MGLDKRIARTFFSRHSPVIHQQFAEFTIKNNRYPSPEDFIKILERIIQNQALPIASNIRDAMTTDNMHCGQKFIEEELEIIKKKFGPLRPPSPPPAPTPAPSSSEPEFSGGYLTNNDDSKRRLVTEQGLVDADAATAINLGDPKEHEGTLKGVRSRGDYLHRTCKSHGPYGVKDQHHGGGKVVTFLYRRQGGATYLVGMAEHITSSVYHVTRTFIADLIERDRLTF